LRIRGGEIHLEPPGNLTTFERVVVDVDGTMLLGDRATLGAREFVEAFLSIGSTVCFATNASFATGEDVGRRLRAAGIPAEDHLVLTAIEVLAGYLRTGHLRSTGETGPIAFLGSDPAFGILNRAEPGVIRARDADPAEPIGDLVIAGLSRDVDDVEVESAATALAPEVRVTVPNLDVGMVDSTGVIPGSATVLARLTRLSPALLDVTDVGKPTTVFADALDRVAPCRGRTLIVGDSLTSDTPLGTDRGWKSLLVLTGATVQAGLAGLEGEPPDMVAANLQVALERGWGSR